MAQKRKDKAKKRVVHVEALGQAHIHASFNNIIISLTNSQGQVITWASAGKMGFKGSKKNTPYAAQVAASDCAQKAYDLGLRKVDVFVKGPGSGRDAAALWCGQSTANLPQPGCPGACLLPGWEYGQKPEVEAERRSGCLGRNCLRAGGLRRSGA